MSNIRQHRKQLSNHKTLYMKHLFALTLISLFIPFASKAQTATPPVPDVLNEVRYRQPSDNALKPLEKTKAAYAAKAKALGLGGIALRFVVDGEKSSVRLAPADRMFFVVALADGMGDPTSWFTLYKAAVKKGKRSGVFDDSKTFGKSSAGKDVISYSVRKISNQGYEIIIDSKLEKGEYFFVNKGTLSKYGNTAADVFAFGVD